jgi:hypothetical protein
MTKSELWQKHLDNQAASGLSQIDYCKQHNIKVATLQYWRKKLKTVGTKKLIPVVNSSSSVQARLQLGSSVVIDLPSHEIPALLASLKHKGLLHA